MARWRKLGRIFELAPSPSRSTTHAQVPTVLLKPDRARVYFAARNPAGKSYPGYVDLKRTDLTKVIEVQENALMEFGKPGTFDDEGIMPAHVLEHEDGLWMYYSGWNRRVSVPYHNSTGLAVSHDGGESFARKFEGPVLDRTPQEPYLAVTPSVLRDNNKWHIWYISGLGWESVAGKFEPVYVIKYATSTDGIYWQRPNLQCIAQTHPLEAFSHPTVIKRGDTFHMWYCFRHSENYRGGTGSYRIGYARSADGMKWQRLDEDAGISVSADGWDCAMQCYPYVIAIDGQTYLFYNGNGFGQSGIGLAVLDIL
jgi:hypothetical protein